MKRPKPKEAAPVPSAPIGDLHDPGKAIEMLRLDRELAPALKRWREAVRKNPE